MKDWKITLAQLAPEVMNLSDNTKKALEVMKGHGEEPQKKETQGEEEKPKDEH